MESLKGLTAAVITVSDSRSRGEEIDEGGPLAEGILRDAGANVADKRVIPDDRLVISAAIKELSGNGIDLIITTGGTGVAQRDITPEATADACERMIPGIGEAMRNASIDKTPYAVLSRATAGVCGAAVVVNLPGSPGGVSDCLTAVLDVLGHAAKLAKGAGTAHRQT